MHGSALGATTAGRPPDEHARYEIQLEIDGDLLEPASVRERYRIRARNVDP
jgi:hypothetical protein